MAQPKSKLSGIPVSKRITRSQSKQAANLFVEPVNKNGKRKNDENVKQPPTKRQRNVPTTNDSTALATLNPNKNPIEMNVTKRPVLRSISNVDASSMKFKKTISQKSTSSLPRILNDQSASMLNKAPLRQPKIATRAARAKANQKETKLEELKNSVKRRISNNFDESVESLYYSASEDLSFTSMRFSTNSRLSVSFDDKSNESMATAIGDDSQNELPAQYEVPLGIVDIDKITENSACYVSEYAMDIFNYLKQRESKYPIEDYMKKHQINPWMRTLLVDWMCGVQNIFNLNHESLYLGVKIIDSALSKMDIDKEQLQLLGAVAMLLASKYDMRNNSSVDDFQFVCDDVYTREEIIEMEIEVFKAINYDLSFPLSYTFLRRYAICANVSNLHLTYARYILEMNLMNYATITFSDSKMACAALFMALKFSEEPGWNKTLEYYSGYKLADFASIVIVLNTEMQRKQHDAIKSVKSKYSTSLFYSVATFPILSNEEYFT